MKVLVTGATGLVGSHLTEALVRKKYQVRCFVEASSDTSLLESLGVEIIRGDIRDPQSVDHAVRNCQNVYHLAAQVALPGISSRTYYDVNVGGTKNVAQACVNHGVERLIYGSTTGVYGTINLPLVDETTRPNPDSPYRRTKWLAEQLVMAYYRHEALPVVAARLTSVTGARANEWSGLLRAIARGNFRGMGSWGNYHHTVDVHDAVQGLLCCANVKKIEGECYLIAGEKPIRLRQLLNLLARELGVGPVVMQGSIIPFRLFGETASVLYRYLGIQIPYGTRYSLFLTNKTLDIRKAQRELNYSPKIPITQSIRHMVNWYRYHENRLAS
jgi:nucleoside-diphosphate-sugar epimerase